jgi:riboflavin kinase/FMN adenylyltransferase
MSIYSLQNFPASMRPCVLTIGNFDGVHRGHQALINKILSIKKNYRAGALTFSPHPFHFLYPDRDFFTLTSDAHKAELLLNYGLDFVIIHELDRNFLNISAQDFISSILKEALMCKALVVGEDFSFGAKALGTIAELKSQSFDLHVLPDHLVLAKRCSSSAIRKYLIKAELDKARHFLGRPFSLRGVVKPGLALARQLGFNTANIIPDKSFALARGVYMTLSYINNNYYISITNVGVKPSINNNCQLVVETHCIDQDLDLYEAQLEIFFLKRIRDEKKFPSLEALKSQVLHDIDYVRNYAAKYKENLIINT